MIWRLMITEGKSYRRVDQAARCASASPARADPPPPCNSHIDLHNPSQIPFAKGRNYPSLTKRGEGRFAIFAAIQFSEF